MAPESIDTMAKAKTPTPAAPRGRAAKPAVPPPPAPRGKKPAPAPTKPRARQQKLAGVTADGNHEDLNEAIADAYAKTSAWKAALQPMVDAKSTVQELLKKKRLTVYTTDEDVTATLVAASEKITLAGPKKVRGGNPDTVDFDGDE